MQRPARLEAAKRWIPTYSGKNLVRGYARWFRVDLGCALKELQLLGVPLDPAYVERLRQALRDRSKLRRTALSNANGVPEGYGSEWDDTFAFIAGVTEGGAEFGVTWEEQRSAGLPNDEFGIPVAAAADEEFAFVAGVTADGVPFGVTWNDRLDAEPECEALDEIFEPHGHPAARRSEDGSFGTMDQRSRSELAPENEGSVMARKAIDRGKLSAVIEGMGEDQLRDLLATAVDLLPDSKLGALVEHHVDPEMLRPDPKGKGRLLADIRAFAEASRRGDYYESFRVNSRNYMEKSAGTRTFVAQCNRLLDRCVDRMKSGDRKEAGEALAAMLELLRYVDDHLDDVLFFADEAGLWQVGVDWSVVLPAWFACLAETEEPVEFARKVVGAIDEFDRFDRKKHLTAARLVATPGQQKALRALAKQRAAED